MKNRKPLSPDKSHHPTSILYYRKNEIERDNNHTIKRQRNHKFCSVVWCLAIQKIPTESVALPSKHRKITRPTEFILCT